MCVQVEDACDSVSHSVVNDPLALEDSGSDRTPRLGLLLGCFLPPSVSDAAIILPFIDAILQFS